MGRAVTWLATAVAVLAVFAPVAAASDASVRTAVGNAENNRLLPAVQAMLRAEKRFEKTERAAPLRASVKRVIATVDAVRPLIVREAPASDKVRRGKALFLTALRDFRTALRAFDRGLREFQAGRRSSAAAVLQRAAKRFDTVDREETRALKLLGLD